MSSTRPAARGLSPEPTESNGQQSDGHRSSLTLGPRDRLKGSLFVEGDLVVVGTVDGELEVTGDVQIDHGGRVSGPVTARHRLVVGPSGSMIGDVRVSRLIVQDGAKFTGNVSMVKPGEVLAKPQQKDPAPAPTVAVAPVAAETPQVVAAAPPPVATVTPPAVAEAPKAAAAPKVAEAPKAAAAPKVAEAPKLAEAPKAPEASRPDAHAPKKEAWQLVKPARQNGKSNHPKGRRR